MRITALAHKFVAEILREGHRAVDATAGSGRDTLFLADIVGSPGRVYAFDIQEEALKRTAGLLQQAGLQDRVTLVKAGHEGMSGHLEGPVAVVMFNLGFLPGGNREIVTRAETTLEGVEAALQLLAPGGLVTLAVYPGHGEGEEEKKALLSYCAVLPRRLYTVVHLSLHNQPGLPPELLLIYQA